MGREAGAPAPQVLAGRPEMGGNLTTPLWPCPFELWAADLELAMPTTLLPTRLSVPGMVHQGQSQNSAQLRPRGRESDQEVCKCPRGLGLLLPFLGSLAYSADDSRTEERAGERMQPCVEGRVAGGAGAQRSRPPFLLHLLASQA